MVDGLTRSLREAARHKRRVRRYHPKIFIPNWPVHSPPRGGFVLAVSDKARLGFPDRWMLDTGASYHLVSRRDLSPKYKSRIVSCQPLYLQSSNGELVVEHCIHIHFPSFIHSICIHVAEDTPAVLSVGRLAADLGLGFSWPTGGQPSLLLGDGQNGVCIPMHVECNVPFWILGTFPIQKEFAMSTANAPTAIIHDGAACMSPRTDRHTNTGTTGQIVPVPAVDDDIPAPPEEAIPPPPVPGGFEAIPRTRARNSTAHLDRNHLLCHFPKLPNCPICQRAKHTRLPARRRLCVIQRRHRVQAFGQCVCGDFIIDKRSYNTSYPPTEDKYKVDGPLAVDDQLRTLDDSAEDYDEEISLAAAVRGKPVALVLYDVYTQWTQVHSIERRDAATVLDQMLDFQGTDPDQKVTGFFSDRAPELIRAANNANWRHTTSTPYRHQSNGLMESINRRILDGTRCLLEQAGLPATWWVWAAQCFVWQRNTMIVDGESAWNNRHQNGHFDGHLLPFGSLCWYKPTPPEEAKLSAWESRSIPAIFLGYVAQPGGKWLRDYWVAPLQHFGIHRDRALQGDKASVSVRIIQEIIPPPTGEYRFPLRAAYERFTEELRGLLTGSFKLNLPSKTDYERFGLKTEGPVHTSTDRLAEAIRARAQLQEHYKKTGQWDTTAFSNIPIPLPAIEYVPPDEEEAPRAEYPDRVRGATGSRSTIQEINDADRLALEVPPGFQHPDEKPLPEDNVLIRTLQPTRPLSITPIPKPPAINPPLTTPMHSDTQPAPPPHWTADMIHADNPVRRKGYKPDVRITPGMKEKYGRTIGCYACDGSVQSHSNRCITRFRILTQSDPEFLASQGRGPRGGPIPSALAAAEGGVPCLCRSCVAMDKPTIPTYNTDTTDNTQQNDADDTTDDVPVDPLDELNPFTQNYYDSRRKAVTYAVAARRAAGTDTEIVGHRRQYKELQGTYNKHNKKKQPRQTLIHFCSDEDNSLGNNIPDNVHVIHLTKKMDMTTEAGYRYASKAIELAAPNVLLWGSLPTKAGIHKKNRNGNTHTDRTTFEKERNTYNDLIAIFELLARECKQKGGRVTLEWPRECYYWRQPEVKNLIQDLDLTTVNIDGCYFHTRNRPGKKLIKNPRTICTNSMELSYQLQKCKCPKTGEHRHHAAAYADNSLGFDRYTTEFCAKVYQAMDDEFKEKGPNEYKDVIKEAFAHHECGHPDKHDGLPKYASAVLNKIREFEAKDATIRLQKLYNKHMGGKGKELPEIYNDRIDVYDIPKIPCFDPIGGHHSRKSQRHQTPFALIARSIGKKEMLRIPKAQDAVREEFDKLMSQAVFAMEKVEEWKDVRDRARANREKIHIGRIFALCVEKGSELPKDHKDRKYKGRIVFMGNQVRDEYHDYAIFQDLSSSPAALEGTKAIDAYGSLPDHCVMQADAKQAYVQAELDSDTATWVRLPPEYWPDHWHGKYQDPVVPMRKALYGHPDAGGMWEKHAESIVFELGYQKIDGWDSCYFDPVRGLLLSVYVDDFKLAGPAKYMQEAWNELRERIDMDEPTPLEKYLGCIHKQEKTTVNGKQVTKVTYDMEEFANQCVTSYLQMTNSEKDCLRSVQSPFVECPPEEELMDTGYLQPISSSILMKVLYMARVARYDLLKAVSYLASRITKWTRACDRKLHRLISYINTSRNYVLEGYVGDRAEDLKLSLYSDADFAGCKVTMRSTSGVYLVLSGPNTFYPIMALSRKQVCVSHSTPEAEMVAANLALRAIGLPALNLWDTILQRRTELTLMEDNTATIQIMLTGKTPMLRHLSRTHGVNLQWVHERLTGRVPSDSALSVSYCKTHDQCADILTKDFQSYPKWRHALYLLGIRPKNTNTTWGQMEEPIKKKKAPTTDTKQPDTKANAKDGRRLLA